MSIFFKSVAIKHPVYGPYGDYVRGGALIRGVALLRDYTVICLSVCIYVLYLILCAEPY